MLGNMLAKSFGLTSWCLPTDVRAVKAMCAGCAARRLKPTHIGKLTPTTGMSRHPVMVERMMLAWIKHEWKGDVAFGQAAHEYGMALLTVDVLV